MDKMVNYLIKDMLSKENIEVSIRITTSGFPVNEEVEYYHDGKWSKDIYALTKDFNAKRLQGSWSNFQSRLLSFLDDGNMMVILDIMSRNDYYFSDKYNLKISVTEYKLLD